ncbi:MAG: CoA transferase [Cytophagales bacterium]|nr:CoA transferase [Cytophagales bacterium]
MKPLKGTRIVSLALNLPGPAALMRCRALGATCIKFEPLAGAGGDPMRMYKPAAYQELHLGVRVLEADLKTPQGQAKLAKELGKADVFLTSFRPSAMGRLGLDWKTLHKRYPDLSQVAIVGGEGLNVEVAGHDLTYLAENDLVGGLDLPATLFADMTGSLLAVEAIMSAALLKKPSYQAVALSNAASYAALPRSWGLTTADGAVGGAHAGYQVYQCEDGRAAVAALEPHFAQRLCEVAGIDTSGKNMMLLSATKLSLQRWFAKQSCQTLDRLALKHDLPIYTMPLVK